MIGDAVPIRLSRRIQRKARLSPVRVPVKKKTRRSAVKKRTSGANSSFLKASEKSKVVRKNKSKKNPKHISDLNSSLLKVTEKAEVGKKTKSEKNSKQVSKQSSLNSKPAAHKRSRQDISKIVDQKRKTRTSLNASHVYITDDKQQNLKLELTNERKRVIKKKNHADITGSKKNCVRRSSRVYKSSLLAEDKEIREVLNDSKLKSSRAKKPSRKKRSLQETSASPEPVITPNTRKSKRTSRHSERKKSARLSTESLNKETYRHTPVPKSLPVTPHPNKVTRATRHAENRKSSRSPKGPNRSRILNSGNFLSTSAFQSILETPHPEKNSEKRKSSRILKPNLLRTLNKDVALSTPASVLEKNQDSMLNKSSELSKSVKLLAAENSVGKRGRPRLSNKEIKPTENRKSARSAKEPNQSRILNSGISLNTSAFQSILETPHPEKNSEKRKSSRILEPNQLRTLIKEVALSTPASVLAKNQDSMLNKSSELSKSVKLLAAENPVGKRGRPRLSNKEIKPAENPKSARSSKEPNQSRILNSGISLNTSAFQSILETPLPEKQSEKRKSSRILEPSPLRTLNKELSLSTSESILVKNRDSMLNKSSELSKSAENHGKKQGRPRLSNKEVTTDSFEKLKPSRKRQVDQQKKSSENFKLPLPKVTDNLPLDILSTSAFTPIHVKSVSKKCLSKTDAKSSKRKFHLSLTENHVASEKVQNAKQRKKSAGDNVCMDNSTSPSKYRTMKKSISPFKNDYMKKLKENQISESYQMPRMSNLCNIDVLTANLPKKLSQKRTRSAPNKNKINCLSIVGERKGKSTGNHKRKPRKRIMSTVMPQNEYDASCSDSDTDTEKETTAAKMYTTKTPMRYVIPIVNSKSNLAIKEDFLSSNLFEIKHKRARTAPSKTNKFNEGVLFSKIETSSAYHKQPLIMTIAPIKFTRNVDQNTESSHVNSFMKELSQLPIDNLTGNKDALSSQNEGKRLVINKLTPYKGRKKNHSWPLGNGLSSENSSKYDFPNMRVKGTLKHKRWLLNNLKETNAGYEDDIFENQNFDNYKKVFHFGDESDGSSVNIATPKFDCILTPALPKKTPRFKDCISPTELLQARKTAEEYLYRRNKKRKSGDMPSPSRKKTCMNKKYTTRSIPEKKKLDFEETVNKLIAVQQNLEKDAEIDDEEEDTYFSDASN